MGISTGAAILGGSLVGTAGSALQANRVAKGAKQAAIIQGLVGMHTSNLLKRDMAPFRELGLMGAEALLQEGILESPEVTAEDVLTDPFFQAMARDQEQQTLAQRAALGLAGSGGTQDILQRNLLQLGEGFRQQKRLEDLQEQQARFNQLFNITGMGQAATAGTAAQSANIMTDIGSAFSTVPLIKAQGQNQLISNIAGLGGNLLGVAATGGFGGGGGLSALGSGSAVGGGTLPGGMAAFSDSRLKNNIVKVGADEFGNIYEFSYNGVIGRYRGRIAQELQQIKPDAVTMHESGFLQVSYEFRSEAV